MRLIIKQQESDGEQPDPQKNGLESNAVENHQAMHLLPCMIHPLEKDVNDDQTLVAPVDRYFHPYTKPETTAAAHSADGQNDNADAAVWHASLRGKPLTGVKLSMPEGYSGLLCKKVKNNDETDHDEDLISDGDVIKQFMYWNWDRIPTREDPLLAAFDWVRVSEAMMADDD